MNINSTVRVEALLYGSNRPFIQCFSQCLLATGGVLSSAFSTRSLSLLLTTSPQRCMRRCVAVAFRIVRLHYTTEQTLDYSSCRSLDSSDAMRLETELTREFSSEAQRSRLLQCAHRAARCAGRARTAQCATGSSTRRVAAASASRPCSSCFRIRLRAAHSTPALSQNHFRAYSLPLPSRCRAPIPAGGLRPFRAVGARVRRHSRL